MESSAARRAAADRGGRASDGDVAGKLRPGKRRKVRLDDAIAWFLDSWPYEGPRVPSAQTVRTYRGHLEWLAAFAARQRRFYVTDLSPELLRLAFREILATPTSSARNYKGGEAKANGVGFAVRALARWLSAQGVTVPEITRVRPPKVPARIQPRLQPGEFQALEHAILRRLVDTTVYVPRYTVARDLALIYLLSDTGLRANEVCSMHVQDVDLFGGSITVRRGKGGKQRMISIRDASDPTGGATLRRLSEWIDARAALERCTRHDMLWVSVRGLPLNPDLLRYVLNRICVAAGIEGNRPPHAFRRGSFTERYNEQPSDLPLLVERMGWSRTSGELIDTYVRGAQISAAATKELPSLASRWHSGSRPNRQPAWGTFGTGPQTAANLPSRGRRSQAK